MLNTTDITRQSKILLAVFISIPIALSLTMSSPAIAVRDNYDHNQSLVGADFHGKDLTSAVFTKANCQAADFSSAILRNANIEDANFIEANLEGADLRMVLAT